MASAHEIVGQEWAERAGELADWAMQYLVNRKDLWGQYSVLTPSEKRRSKTGYKAMTLPQPDLRTGEDMVTLDKLTRHFASRHGRKPQIIGLHAKSRQNTSRWFAIDIDCHDTEAATAQDHARRNLAGALQWVEQLQAMGYDPLLFDSNGAGGFHLWILLAEPAPTKDVFALVHSLVTQWRSMNLDEEPETFPKKVRPRSMGSWFRLPGLHHSREHYARLYSGDDWLSDPWLSGHAAIDQMLQVVPGPPPPKADPEAAYAPRTTRATAGIDRAQRAEAAQMAKTATSRRSLGHKRARRAIVCVDLDGVLASREYRTALDVVGEPLPGAVEFTRELAGFADVVILTSRLGSRPGSVEKDQARIRDAIAAWLEHHGFAFSDIYVGAGKPVASAYIDDRGVSCQPEKSGISAYKTALAAAQGLCED